MMKKILIFGASGLVGNALTNQLKDQYQVTIAIRDQAAREENLTIRIIDFEKFSDFSIEEYDGVYCCLGTTIKKAGSKELFKRVDLDYVKLCFDYSIKAKAKFFCVISAIGANKDSSVFYNKVKGEMENSLTGNQRVIIVRPSLLIGKRNESRPLEQITNMIASPFIKILPVVLGKYAPIRASQVAKSMVEISMSGHTTEKIDYIIKRP